MKSEYLIGGVPCDYRDDRVEMNGDPGVAWKDPDNDDQERKTGTGTLDNSASGSKLLPQLRRMFP